MERDLKGLRAEMDCIDEQLCALLGRRARLVREIFRFKSERGLMLLDAAREAEIVHHSGSGDKTGYGEEGLKRIFRSILQESGELAKEFEDPTLP